MSNKESVSVIIDTNEEAQAPETVETFVLHEDVEEFTFETLEQKEGAWTGDFIVENCLFERKTPSDFASSVQNGHLRDQVERMAESDYQPYILVEGDMSDFSTLEHSHMPSKSLRGMTASIMARNGIPVVFCSEPKYLADIAIRIARKSIEGINNHHVKSTDAVKDDIPFVTQFFMNIEGVGLSTAEDLSDEFNSVQEALEASVEELSSVGGIGDVRAKNIHEAIHEGEEEPDTENRSGPIRV